MNIDRKSRLPYAWLGIACVTLSQVSQADFVAKIKGVSRDGGELVIEYGPHPAPLPGEMVPVKLRNRPTCNMEAIELAGTNVRLDSRFCNESNQIKVGEKVIIGAAIEGSATQGEVSQEELPSIRGTRHSELQVETPKRRPTSLVPVEGPPTWYTVWGIGIGVAVYGNSFTKPISDNNTTFAIAADVAGLYWPTRNQDSMVGLIANIALNNHNANVSHVMLGYSYVRFFGEGIGDSIFIRGDIGPAIYTVSIPSAGGGSTSSTSPVGLGLLLGGGKVFSLQGDVKLMLGSYATYRYIGGASLGFLTLSTGFIF